MITAQEVAGLNPAVVTSKTHKLLRFVGFFVFSFVTFVTYFSFPWSYICFCNLFYEDFYSFIFIGISCWLSRFKKIILCCWK
ncbi:hypothetical protein E1J38_007005 [Seonamhaeicola sediminis]|uniref:NADH:ubiquinone oxidoreductase chain 4 N-terminal domain-containing protein n=1 Tax=Seonamhaeicola sediminis TaxID=2528206 RepID=A0A562YFJ4_9FLAO|nr:hypothetical protein E1J38_007005 [Seonamhaeicola sediminis]